MRVRRAWNPASRGAMGSKTYRAAVCVRTATASDGYHSVLSSVPMWQRTAPIVVLLALAPGGHAQAPASPTAEPLESRAVMTGDQVIRILDETVDWFRML